MIYRDANLNDLPFIVDVYNSTIASRLVTADTSNVTVEDKLEWFNEHNTTHRPLWIAEDDHGNHIGWISFQDFYGRPAYQGTAEISIYIHENNRKKGYGREMLSFSISQCPTLGIETLLGFIFEQNTESLQLFSTLGFEEWGNLKDIAMLDNKKCSLKILGRKI